MARQYTVKIQRPLASSDGNMGKLLIYDKRRSFEGEVDLPAETIKGLFPDGGHKGFARGKLVGTKFHIEHLLAVEDWPTW